MQSAGGHGRDGGRPIAMAARRQSLAVALPLATGAALVVYLVAGLSLPIALLATVTVAVATVVTVWRRTPVAARATLARRARIGLVIGIAATAAYDLTRLAGAELGGTGSTGGSSSIRRGSAPRSWSPTASA
jgi:hypothetical protein